MPLCLGGSSCHLTISVPRASHRQRMALVSTNRKDACGWRQQRCSPLLPIRCVSRCMWPPPQHYASCHMRCTLLNVTTRTAPAAFSLTSEDLAGLHMSSIGRRRGRCPSCRIPAARPHPSSQAAAHQPRFHLKNNLINRSAQPPHRQTTGAGGIQPPCCMRLHQCAGDRCKQPAAHMLSPITSTRACKQRLAGERGRKCAPRHATCIVLCGKVTALRLAQTQTSILGTSPGLAGGLLCLAHAHMMQPKTSRSPLLRSRATSMAPEQQQEPHQRQHQLRLCSPPQSEVPCQHAPKAPCSSVLLQALPAGLPCDKAERVASAATCSTTRPSLRCLPPTPYRRKPRHPAIPQHHLTAAVAQ